MGSEKNGIGTDGGDGADRRLSALDRAIQQALGDGRQVGREDDPARKKYPELWEWLANTRGGQDHIMQPAVITLQLGPEGVLVSLTHRDLKCSVTVSCPHMGDFLASLERELTGPAPAIKSWGKDPEVRLRKRRPK